MFIRLILLLLILTIPSVSDAWLIKSNFVYGTIGANNIGSAEGEDATFTIAYGTNSNTFSTCTNANPCRIVVYDAACSTASSCANREIIDLKTVSGTTCTIKGRNAETPNCTSCTFAEGAKFIEAFTVNAENHMAPLCINIDPSATTTDWFMVKVPYAITVTGIDCIVDAATSVVLTPQECNGDGASCSDIEAAITCAATNTTEGGGSVDNPSIDAGDWIRVTRGTVTGSPMQAVLCIEYTRNN